MVIKKLIINQEIISYAFNNLEQISVQGQIVQVSLEKFDQASGELVFYVNNNPYKARLITSINSQGDLVTHVSLAHVPQEFTVQAEASQKPANFIPAKQVQVNSLKSPLAGRVTKILVTKGESIVPGQPLLLIESMKMENEICSQSAAFIKTIFIGEGNVVQPNQILMEFENKGESDAAAQNSYEQETISHR